MTVHNFADGETDGQVDGGDNHGTACAEIIHDVAPDAQLYLAKIATDVDLDEAVEWMKQEGVDIISTSSGFLNAGPGDGTGSLAELGDDARQNGILWVTSAGNYRQEHWGGSFYDLDGDGWHNFSGGTEINPFSDLLPADRELAVYLRWDDWTQVEQDYNLCLVRCNSFLNDWEFIWSTDVQNGGTGQKPMEEIPLAYTSGAPTYYGFAIYRYDATRDVHFEALAFVEPYSSPLNLQVHARSLANLADAPDAMTVAALDVSSPYPQESYSSEGPTNGPGGTGFGGFTKPDIAAYANVSTGSWPSFAGTSAATPHAAGAAVLVLSAYPYYTPDQPQSFLEGQTIDMGESGMDTIYGHGRLHLGDPPSPTPTATNTPTMTPTETQTPTTTPSSMPTNTPTMTHTPTASHTPTAVPTIPELPPTATDTPTATNTQTMTPTETPTATETATPTSAPASPSPTGTPSAYPYPDITASPTPIPKVFLPLVLRSYVAPGPGGS